MSQLPPMLPPVSDEDAPPEVAAVYADIRATRGTDFVNDFWRVLAHDPALLKRTWEDVKAVMAPGALDPLVKEMIYVAVSVTNGCTYCINTHTAAARAKGMTDAMLMELLGVVGMANETNRLVTGLQVPVDAPFLEGRGNTPADPPAEPPAEPASAGRAKAARKAGGKTANAPAASAAPSPKTSASKKATTKKTGAAAGSAPKKAARSTASAAAKGDANGAAEPAGETGTKPAARARTTRRKAKSADA